MFCECDWVLRIKTKIIVVIVIVIVFVLFAYREWESHCRRYKTVETNSYLVVSSETRSRIRLLAQSFAYRWFHIQCSHTYDREWFGVFSLCVANAQTIHTTVLRRDFLLCFRNWQNEKYRTTICFSNFIRSWSFVQMRPVSVNEQTIENQNKYVHILCKIQCAARWVKGPCANVNTQEDKEQEA